MVSFLFFFFCLISLIPSCLDSAWNLKLRFIHWVQRWKVSEETLVSGLRNRSQSSLQNSEWGNCPVLCFFKFLSFYLNKRGRGREREGEERERERENRNRTSENRGTIGRSLIFLSLKFQKERTAEKIFEEKKSVDESYKTIDSRSSANSKTDKHKEIHAQIHHNKTES